MEWIAEYYVFCLVFMWVGLGYESVLLDKGDKQKKKEYADHFFSAILFCWLSVPMWFCGMAGNIIYKLSHPKVPTDQAGKDIAKAAKGKTNKEGGCQMAKVIIDGHCRVCGAANYTCQPPQGGGECK